MANTTKLGTPVYGHHITTTEVSDGTGSAGDFVTLDNDGHVTVVTSVSDEVFGVLREDAPADGEKVGVGVAGAFYGNVSSAVSKGDYLKSDGSNDGRCNALSGGSYVSVDESGSATHVVSSDAPKALEDGNADNVGAVYLR